MNHEILIAEFLSTPWAMAPERLFAFADVLTRWGAGVRLTVEDLAQYQANAEIVAARRGAAQAAGGEGVAVIPVYGVLTKRGNMAQSISGPGATSTDQLAAQVRAAVDSPSVTAVVLDVDSPGGSVHGVNELADEIYNARGKKPIVAVANATAASAAYWLASQAEQLYATPSGEVGSIGVFAAHKDVSAAQEKAGVKTTLISAGPFKTEGSPYAPLSEDARAYMQARIDDYYGQFVRAVARGRGASVADVRDGMGGGRMLGASDAKAAGMVDGLATLDDVVRKVARATATQSKALNRAAMARRQFGISG